MTLPFWFVSLAIVVGIGGIWLALHTHWAEDRERRRIQIHQWALDEERAILKAAAAPRLYRGYRIPPTPQMFDAAPGVSELIKRGELPMTDWKTPESK